MSTPKVRTRLARAHRAMAAAVAAGLLAAAPAPSVVTAQTPARPAAPDTAALAAVLTRLAAPGLPALPPAGAFRPGSRTIAESARDSGPVAVRDGTVHVYGTVTGDVVTYLGDIVVHGRGEITGNAIAIDGRVQLDGGQIAGQSLTLVSDQPVAPVPAPPALARVMHGVLLVGAWLAILLVICVAVLALMPENLATVADALERHYGDALVAGVAGQVAAGPLLLALIVALVLSLLGVLLVPFAIVAYVVLCAGLVMLGFLATAVVVGRGWRPAPPGSERARRGSTLRAAVVGLAVLLAPWLVAAVLAAWPAAEWLARGVALAVTWVACTAGLGAALMSRAGMRRAKSREVEHALASPSWQTPTPVSGVAAARRPVQTPSAGAR